MDSVSRALSYPQLVTPFPDVGVLHPSDSQTQINSPSFLITQRKVLKTVAAELIVIAIIRKAD